MNQMMPGAVLHFPVHTDTKNALFTFGRMGYTDCTETNNAVEIQKVHNEWGLRLFLKVETELGNQYCIRFSPSTSVETYLERDSF